jgi:hypothetical protein
MERATNVEKAPVDRIEIVRRRVLGEESEGGAERMMRRTPS